MGCALSVCLVVCVRGWTCIWSGPTQTGSHAHDVEPRLHWCWWVFGEVMEVMQEAEIQRSMATSAKVGNLAHLSARRQKGLVPEVITCRADLIFRTNLMAQ